MVISKLLLKVMFSKAIKHYLGVALPNIKHLEYT